MVPQVSRLGAVKSLNERDDRGLTGPGRAHDRCYLTFSNLWAASSLVSPCNKQVNQDDMWEATYLEVQAFENRDIWPCRVAEPDVFEFDRDAFL